MEALAAAAISIIAPYIAKGAEAFAQEAGKQAVGAVRALAERLQRWWSRDPVAAVAAEHLLDDPDRYSQTLGQLLGDALARDAAFAEEVRTLVDGVGPHIDVVQRMEVAQGVTGAAIGRLLRGSVSVRQDIGEARDVTGFKADEVG